jgi:hypothetical protein
MKTFYVELVSNHLPHVFWGSVQAYDETGARIYAGATYPGYQIRAIWQA